MPHRRPARAGLHLVPGVVLVAAVLMLTYGLATPARADATTFFVAPTGSDTANGTSATPFRTLQHALDLAQPGTTITLAAGTYQEAVTTKVAGTAAAPIRVEGPETGKAASGRYQAVLVSPGGKAFSINHSYYTLDGFTIDGQPKIARSAYPTVTALSGIRTFKDSVQSSAVNSKLVYVGASDKVADLTGITISNMFLTGSGGECVRFRNRTTNSTVTGSVIQWCGMYGRGDDKDQYRYHNGEGVYIGTSPVSTDQPYAPNDTTNGVVVRDSTVNTYGSECFEVKENAHDNRLENSDCGFNDEPLSFRGSNVELRGDHNVVTGSRVGPSRSWNVKLWSDAPSYDRGGNALQNSSFSGAAGAAIHNQQANKDTSFCGNTVAAPVSDGSPAITDPTAPCTASSTTTAPTTTTSTTAPTTSTSSTTTTTTPTTTTTTPTTTSATTTTPSTTTPPATATTAPPVTPQVIAVEAEAGTLTAPMAVRTDSAAQGGRYVSQTGGSSVGRDAVAVTVPAAGRYTLALRVITPDGSSDSVNFAVDAGSAAGWNLGTHRSWTWVTGPTFTLTAGRHTVVLSRREYGARVDALRLAPR